METKVNTSDSLLEKMRIDEKMELLNKGIYLELIKKMNTHLESHRRDYKVKEVKSIESASKSILLV